jgi:very-short-patch-repair endonuclease
MRMLPNEVRALVEREGVVARKHHPELTGTIDRLVRTGELVPVLPGVYSTALRAQERTTRVLALACRHPDAVLVEHTAAQLSFWPEARGDQVAYALRRKTHPQPGFRVVRSSVPPDLVMERGPLRLSVPALTALDLCAHVGGDGIDQALLTRTATLAEMHRALELTAGRPGNRDRRALLLDSRDEPWSAAERLCHRLLRGARISGWKSNWPVTIEENLYYLDVAFPRLRVVVEIDGRLHQRDAGVFESDRWRQNALVLDGWLVLRFTWRMLDEHPEHVIETIRRALTMQGR